MRLAPYRYRCGRCRVAPPVGISRYCRPCGALHWREARLDGRVKPTLAKGQVLCRTMRGRYYAVWPTGRRCQTCSTILSIFNGLKRCRPCQEQARSPSRFSLGHAQETASKHVLYKLGRKHCLNRLRLGVLGAKQDTHAPAWVHPMADALEQWETYCEEIAR